MGEEMVIGEVFCKIFFIIGLEFFMYGILVFSFFVRKYCFYGLDIDIILELCGIFWEFCCDNGSCVCIVLFGKCFGKMDVNCEFWILIVWMYKFRFGELDSFKYFVGKLDDECLFCSLIFWKVLIFENEFIRFL